MMKKKPTKEERNTREKHKNRYCDIIVQHFRFKFFVEQIAQLEINQRPNSGE